MTAGGARSRPLTASTDLAHGGRWTSLSTPEREWLWRNPRVPAAARAAVRPGDAFVDAGGGEECFPTVVGTPDHGDAWSRPWTRTRGGATVDAGGLTIARRLDVVDGAVRARYRVGAPAGVGLLHAVHLLLDLSPAARLVVPGEPAVVVSDWPRPGRDTATVWPDGGGVPLDRLGADDRTARCAVVATSAVDVVDGEDRLRLRWRLLSGRAPLSLVVWRNLGGWPDRAPYRSVGVEPLLGAATDRARADPDRLARCDGGAGLAWELVVSAQRGRTAAPNT